MTSGAACPVEQRLRALGHVLPEPTATHYAYLPALCHRGTVHVAGQIPKLSADRLMAYGRLGEAGVPDALGAEATRLCILHALSWVRHYGGTLGAVEQILRVNYFFQVPTSGYPGMSAMADAGSMLLMEAFGKAGRHPRSVIGVATLPRDAPVLVDMDVALRPESFPGDTFR